MTLRQYKCFQTRSMTPPLPSPPPPAAFGLSNCGFAVSMSKFNLSQTVGANLEWPQTFAKIKVALNHLAKSSILVFTLKVACELQYNLQISLTTAYQTRFDVISICFLVKLNWKAFRFGNVFSSPRVKAYVKPAEWSLQSAIMRSYRQTQTEPFQ